MATTTVNLLRELQRSLPDTERAMASQIPVDLKLLGVRFEVQPPERFRFIPTFDPNTARALTPQMTDRFSFASQIYLGTERWLGIKEMAQELRSRQLLRYHRTLKEHWEGSAPQLFSDNHLSVFALGEKPSDSITYLAWQTEATEPELWVYNGQCSQVFKDLNARLRYELKHV